MDYENRKNKTNFKLPKTAPRAVNKAGGTTRKYKSGGKVLAKAQMGKVVKSAVDVGKVLAKKVRDRKIFGNLSDDIVKDIKKSEPAPKVDKAEAALNRRNREYEKAVWDSYKKKGGTARKYKSGGSKFPDLNGDGEITKADVLKGRGVFKKGGMIKKKK